MVYMMLAFVCLSDGVRGHVRRFFFFFGIYLCFLTTSAFISPQTVVAPSVKFNSRLLAERGGGFLLEAVPPLAEDQPYRPSRRRWIPINCCEVLPMEGDVSTNRKWFVVFMCIFFLCVELGW